MISLPILSSRFFNEHRPEGGFFTKWQAHDCWSEQLLPVYEWSGVLYIGCLRPPQEIPVIHGYKVVLVLCEASVLQNLWLDYQPPKAASPQINASGFEAFENLSAQNPLKTTKDSSGFEEPLEGLTLDIPLAETNLEIPEGLDFSINTKISIDKPADSEVNILQDESEENEIYNKFTEGQQPSAEDMLDLLPPIPEMESQQSSGTSPLMILKPLGHPMPSMESQQADLEKALNPAQSDSSKHPKESSTVSISQAQAKPQTDHRAAPAKSEPLLVGEATRISNQIANSGSTLDPALQKAFEQLSKTFDKSMILLKKGDYVKAWKWDSKFQPQDSTPAEISLLQPSPFRIVARTKKSYHGYIILNDLTKKFFSEWNKEEVPDHLSISPVFLDEQLIGMLLCIGDQHITNDKDTIKLAESVAKSLGEHISSQPSIAKAA